MQLIKVTVGFRCLLMLLALGVFTNERAFADSLPLKVDMPHVKYTSLSSDSSILNDVYVKLYLARLRRAALVVEREKQDLSVNLKRRERAEKVYPSHAISGEELDIRRRDVEVSVIRVQEAEAFYDEAETFVDIAVSRISIGLEMPICAEIR